MPGNRTRAGAVAAMLATAWAGATARAEDDVVAAPRTPAEQRAQARPGIELGAHVDINVLLPPNHWRVGGGIQNLVIAGGGRLVIEGNLTIGGEPAADPAERIRRTDEALLARLRQAQQDRLAAVAADPALSDAQRRSLALATEADVRRVLRDVAAERARFAGRRAHLGDEAWREFQERLTACRRSLADPFGADSLFAAVSAGFAPAP